MPGDEYRLASSKGSTIGGSAAGDVARGPRADEYEEFIEHWKVVEHQLVLRLGRESYRALIADLRRAAPNYPFSQYVYIIEAALREFDGIPEPYHVLNWHADWEAGMREAKTKTVFQPPLELPDAQAH